ncbi:MAG: adenylate/guanylate cyclase domain-containing protein [Lentilitoribacter sp.]|uniref:adenylate/guanylate cyclase domain-containing protein n=1 Tax=Tateyamaria sp. TaxID=1929288 RepID=UPI003293ADB4
MSDVIQRTIDLILWTPPGMEGTDARYYMFHRLGPWVAGFTHGLWAITFALNGVTVMAYYNIAVTLLFVLYGYLWPRRQGPMWYILLLYFGEIPLHALLGTLHAGVGAMFWLFPLVPAIVCLVTPQFSWVRKTLICSALVACAISIGVVAITSQPWVIMPEMSVIFLFVVNTISVSSAFILYLGINQHLVETAEAGLKREYERAENLLHNILPSPIALRLKNGERVIANDHLEVSVIFSDIADFTAASAKLSPRELVESLNLIFTEFDILADRFGAEKIKTIGDAYMVVVGVPEDKRNHAEIAIELATEMLVAAKSISSRTHFDINLRVGINSGPVVAGVIGKRKFAYDLWGDAVNLASRMESQGTPGQIIVTENTAKLLTSRFKVTSEGIRDIKGKGEIPIFSVQSNL